MKIFVMVCVSSPYRFIFEPNFGLVIGIHLGQSISQVGVFRNGTFEVVTDDQGRSDFPSYVALLDVDAPLVGFDAKEQASSNSQTTVYDAR
jgi:molecular chaperone DnaK (HSP70)